MIVVYTAEALADVDSIWEWNLATFGHEHADDYVAFVKGQIDALAVHHARGRPVPRSPGLQYVLVIRGRNRHGHVVVYSVAGEAVSIVHVFGSAQDWQRKLGP